ncbi:MAG: peptide ABC transporter substrate-binding protein [Clostridia bacterium]|nr:peptide ABC transporter substrate-binding protein [Clostridia bacterium]
MKKIILAVLALTLVLAIAATAGAESEKVLHWFINGEVTTMDTTKVYDTVSGEAVFLFADPLYRLDQNADPQPNLAVALPEISEDGTVYTITIRDNAKYSNGDPVKAEDIVYAIQRVFDPAVGSQNSSVTSIKNCLAVRSGELPLEELGIRALSDTVVEITLESADPYFTKKLADTSYSPVSRTFAEAQGDKYALTADALLTSGPFVLSGWTGTEISWSYKKNPYYWDAENIYFDEINYQVIKDQNTALNLYEAGQLDGVNVDSDFIPLYEGQPDLIKINTLRMTNLELNINQQQGDGSYTPHPILSNANIRKALFLAINREELCTDVLNGAAAPAVGVIPNGIASSPDGKSVAESFGNLVSFNKEEAQAAFAKGLEELGVDSVALRLVTSDTDESIKIGTYLQSALQENLPGLTINLANVPSSVRFAEMMGYNFDLALGGWTGDYDPTSYPNQFETNYEHNHAKWVSEELSGLISKLNNEDGNDFEARWEHLREANQYLIDNYVVIPLEQAVKGYLINTSLTGYLTHQLGYSVFDLSRASLSE